MIGIVGQGYVGTAIKVGFEPHYDLETYDKYDETDKRKYSIEINFCDEDDVPYMLREHSIGEDIKLDDLRSFGWNGKVDHNAKIIEFKRQ